ncbi:hypothetical protein CLV84_3221 [Neolewinella xylanilytica]|uniref:Uncharacterized protein n=1 Tax=Neolewinella xylanilytica TaxID=1514080 RepID=A0A2S6I556_9BACT|nr:hypothetical protein CLV84_3221 [Neolewinella xylanilytica]
MLRTLLPALLSLFLTTALQAQFEPDLSGIWTGTLYQNEGGIADRFDLYFDLEQIGPVVKGKAYVQLGDLHAEMRLSGYQTGSGSWRITESEILRNNKAGLEVSWCMKDYELRLAYRDGNLVLNGPWWGSSEYGRCIPGSITLRREAKVASFLLRGEHPVDIQPHGQIHYGYYALHGRLPIRSDEHTVTGAGAAG